MKRRHAAGLAFVALAVLVAFALYQILFTAPEPFLTPADALSTAQALHAQAGAALAQGGNATALLNDAVAAYTQAATAPDARVAAQAGYGLGQVRLAQGDTAAALKIWAGVADRKADSFETLRACKSLADVSLASGDKAGAAKWCDRILAEHTDRGATQQTAVIVAAARAMKAQIKDSNARE